MIISVGQDRDFLKLKEFLFSFDFSYKELVSKQIEHSIIDKTQNEFFIAFRFYVDTLYKPLPVDFSGLAVVVEVLNGDDDHTMCELFVAHGYIVEYRIYNINGTRLNMENFWRGSVAYNKYTTLK